MPLVDNEPILPRGRQVGFQRNLKGMKNMGVPKAGKLLRLENIKPERTLGRLGRLLLVQIKGWSVGNDKRSYSEKFFYKRWGLEDFSPSEGQTVRILKTSEYTADLTGQG